MSYLTPDDWPKGAKKCPTCSTGYFLKPYSKCYLCAHPDERNRFEYHMDEEEDALFAMAFNHGSQN